MIESPFVITIIRVSLLAVVAVLAVRNLRQSWRDYRAASDWPQIRGKAIKSEIVDAGIGSRRGFMGAHTWRVQYSYRVQGQKFTSNPEMPFPNTSKGNAQAMLQKLPVGSPVALRYNPNNPAESKLATNRYGAMAQLGLRIVVYSLASIVIIWATVNFN